jgi:hypothetical protein
MASKLVVTEQVDPMVLLPVVAHGTVTGSSTSLTVAGSSWEAPLSLSVIRMLVVACSCPA